LDDRIRSVAVENVLTSYRMIVDQPAHRNVSEGVIPGVLRRYDTVDLVEAIYPRSITFISPQDAMGAAISEKDFRSALATVFRSDVNLGFPQRVGFQARSSGSSLPLQ